MNKKSKNILEKDKQYVWHPYTQMKDYESSFPLLIKKAKGIKIFDAAGKWYYDIISSWWCNILGHNISVVNKALKKQIHLFEHVLFAGTTNEPATRLAEKLVSITHPNLTKVFYSDNGSTAVEVALKASYQYWQNKNKKKKQKFISLDYGYHGDTIGTMSLSGVEKFNSIFKKLFFKTYSIPSPYCYRCPMNKKYPSCKFACLKPLDTLLATKHKEIAAIIMEPMIHGAGGMIVFPKGYLDALYKIVQKYDIHIILDEVAVGFGRTGKMFAYEYSDLKPDFLCLSKALTNGTMPFAATLTSEEVYSAFYDDYEKGKTFYHGHTFTGNPLASAVALSVVNTITKKKLIKKSQKIIHYIDSKLNLFEQSSAFKIIGDIRHLGFVVAVEIVKNKKTKKPFDSKLRFEFKTFLEGLNHNLIMRPIGNVFYLYLPITVTKKEIDNIFSKFILTLEKSYEKNLS